MLRTLSYIPKKDARIPIRRCPDQTNKQTNTKIWFFFIYSVFSVLIKWKISLLNYNNKCFAIALLLANVKDYLLRKIIEIKELVIHNCKLQFLKISVWLWNFKVMDYFETFLMTVLLKSVLCWKGHRVILQLAYSSILVHIQKCKQARDSWGSILLNAPDVGWFLQC